MVAKVSLPTLVGLVIKYFQQKAAAWCAPAGVLDVYTIKARGADVLDRRGIFRREAFQYLKTPAPSAAAVGPAVWACSLPVVWQTRTVLVIASSVNLQCFDVPVPGYTCSISATPGEADLFCTPVWVQRENMLPRRGLGSLLQSLKRVAEPCSQQTQAACTVTQARAGLHCLAAVNDLNREPGSSRERWHGDRFSGGSSSQSLPWIFKHQIRLASSHTAGVSLGSSSRSDETLEGSELPPDVPPGAGGTSFSPETTADMSLQASGAADSSLDASSILDAVGMAEADALASALEGAWPLTAGMQSVLLGLHSVTGLPW